MLKADGTAAPIRPGSQLEDDDDHALDVLRDTQDGIITGGAA